MNFIVLYSRHVLPTGNSPHFVSFRQKTKRNWPACIQFLPKADTKNTHNFKSSVNKHNTYTTLNNYTIDFIRVYMEKRGNFLVLLDLYVLPMTLMCSLYNHYALSKINENNNTAQRIMTVTTRTTFTIVEMLMLNAIYYAKPTKCFKLFTLLNPSGIFVMLGELARTFERGEGVESGVMSE